MAYNFIYFPSFLAKVSIFIYSGFLRRLILQLEKTY